MSMMFFPSKHFCIDKYTKIQFLGLGACVYVCVCEGGREEEERWEDEEERE